MIEEARCLKCGGKIQKCTYSQLGGWEPDLTPANDPVTWRHENGYAACPPRFAEPRPPIVVLCGSTRFWETFQKENLRLTLEGTIVLSVGGATTSDEEHLRHGVITEEDKIRLDELHKRKIDLADEVLVLNVGGYIGDSTKSEIEYALALGKPIVYLEDV